MGNYLGFYVKEKLWGVGLGAPGSGFLSGCWGSEVLQAFRLSMAGRQNGKGVLGTFR